MIYELSFGDVLMTCPHCWGRGHLIGVATTTAAECWACHGAGRLVARPATAPSARSSVVTESNTMARPLTKTYNPANPFVVERVEHEDPDSISYEIMDTRPESYRIVAFVPEDEEERGQAMRDANMIATALNQVYGARPFKSARLRAISRR